MWMFGSYLQVGIEPRLNSFKYGNHVVGDSRLLNSLFWNKGDDKSEHTFSSFSVILWAQQIYTMQGATKEQIIKSNNST